MEPIVRLCGPCDCLDPAVPDTGTPFTMSWAGMHPFLHDHAPPAWPTDGREYLSHRMVAHLVGKWYSHSSCGCYVLTPVPPSSPRSRGDGLELHTGWVIRVGANPIWPVGVTDLSASCWWAPPGLSPASPSALGSSLCTLGVFVCVCCVCVCVWVQVSFPPFFFSCGTGYGTQGPCACWIWGPF